MKPVVMLAAFFLTVESALAAPEKCPVINGSFGMELYENGKHLGRVHFKVLTHVANSVYSYDIDDSGFQLANGMPRSEKYPRW